MVSSTLPGPSGFGSAELRKKSQSASEDVPINEAWLRSKELNASIIDHLFEQLDKDKNGTLSRIEVIKSLRSNKEVQALLRLPSRIRQEDGTRDAFESVFQAIDRDDSKSISKAEWHQYCLGALSPPSRGVLRLVLLSAVLLLAVATCISLAFAPPPPTPESLHQGVARRALRELSSLFNLPPTTTTSRLFGLW